jgi:hypothetical protein
MRANLYLTGNYNTFTISMLYLIVNSVYLTSQGHEIASNEGIYLSAGSSLLFLPVTNYSLAFSYLMYGVEGL